jgi:regulator of protease activity HflC (stomatin/prohibitin superfamily)
MFFVRILREYERGVVFRLGASSTQRPRRRVPDPVVDRIVKVDLRTITLNIPPQRVITKDNVPARVNAVAYFRIVDPKAAIVQVENFLIATTQIAQTTLRSVLGQHVARRAALRAREDQRRSCKRSSTSRPRPGASRSPSSR